MRPKDFGAASSTESGDELWRHTQQLRVRYSETDQMGTFYNSRPLEWFECGRSEGFRALGLPYATLEERGLFFPLVEARVEYLGRAQYDDLLEMTSYFSWAGRARLKCRVEIVHAESRKPVVAGHTIHAFTDREGRAIRPPDWFHQLLKSALASSARL
ncbi:MAG: acyl-CoA thioesterase [Verrucomicrobia bacterium]|nr:acyl-CoA thioesterase [Verrucomicrobiota bacterium]